MAEDRIYVDMDRTLLFSIWNEELPEPEVTEVVVRPGADEFLLSLREHGPITVLTMASEAYAHQALAHLGSGLDAIEGVIAYEQLLGTIFTLDAVLSSFSSRDPRQKAHLKAISPIAPPGVIFDDYAVGTDIYRIKTTAVGVGQESWIEVDPFDLAVPDHEGLKKAYLEFQSRFLRSRPLGRRITST